MKTKARLVLADDHTLFREAVAGIIAEQPDFEVVGEVSDGLEALVMARELKPDLILMDINMPACDGVEATHLIKQEFPDVTILMLTAELDEARLFEAIRAGAQGYLLKDLHALELIEQLRGVMRGEAAIAPALSSRMLERLRQLSQQAPMLPHESSARLTSREREVISLVARGATDPEVADALHISLNTAKSHMRNILAKLNAENRHEAAREARASGLIP